MTNNKMLTSIHQHAETVVSTLFDYLVLQGQGDYIGEKVSQLEHSLQAAHFAELDGASSEVIIAALLHDVGRFIPRSKEMPAMIAADGTFVGNASHEVLGEEYLRRLGFSEKVCCLVGAHVMAKRYLCAVDKDYYDGLSQSSKTTLDFQGGIFNIEQVKEAERDPWLQDKCRVRRWDDHAKVPNYPHTPQLEHYRALATKVLLSGDDDDNASSTVVRLDGKTYCVPVRPVVVMHVDGLEPQALESDITPTMASFASHGVHYCQLGRSERDIVDCLSGRGVRTSRMKLTRNTMQVLEAAIDLLEQDKADLVHLSITRPSPHPASDVSVAGKKEWSGEERDFCSVLDDYVLKFIHIGADIAIVGGRASHDGDANRQLDSRAAEHGSEVILSRALNDDRTGTGDREQNLDVLGLVLNSQT